MAVKARSEITLTSIRDVQSVTRYYLLQSSTSTAPAKPTKNPPGGNWVTTEPTYTSGSTNSLYFTDCTVFSDGTFVYSDVSLSSSYEAAKVAYNKAAGAADVANSANEKIDNLEIGGRNLIRRTDYAIYGNSNNYANADQAIFSSDRITIPFDKQVWQNQYTRNELKTPIPKGTKIIVSVYVYEQTVPDGIHRLYVAGLSSTGTVNWYNNYKAIPYGFVGKFTWEHTTLEDFYGFLLDFDTRNGTSGQMVLGPVKAEIGTVATDWTPATEDIEADILASQAGTIGGWTIEQDSLSGEQDFGEEKWHVALSPAFGLRFRDIPDGADPDSGWIREVYYNSGLARFSHVSNGNYYTGAIEACNESDGIQVVPELVVSDVDFPDSDDPVTKVTSQSVETDAVKGKGLYLHPLGTGDSFYLQQPIMIMAGQTTISNGTAQKRATICSIPTAYRSGWRIVPFVTRTYGNSGGAPADNGDFYYAYYNSADHEVDIKLANVLPSGGNFTFDYFIYALPIT